MTKEYILKREKNGIWYSYPTGNWYGMNIDEVLEKVEDDLNNFSKENFQLKRIIKKHCPPYIWNAVKLGDR